MCLAFCSCQSNSCQMILLSDKYNLRCNWQYLWNESNVYRAKMWYIEGTLWTMTGGHASLSTLAPLQVLLNKIEKSWVVWCPLVITEVTDERGTLDELEKSVTFTTWPFQPAGQTCKSLCVLSLPQTSFPQENWQKCLFCSEQQIIVRIIKLRRRTSWILELNSLRIQLPCKFSAVPNVATGVCKWCG